MLAKALGALVLLCGPLTLTACLSDPPKPPPPLEHVMFSPYPGPQVIAIAPAINVSPSKDFDPLTVSDMMHGELQQVGGLTVLPVNKTIAAMQALKLRSIDSPETAAKLAELLRADSILLVSIEAYDPYIPPTVGMKIQLYTVKDPADVPTSLVVEARRVDGSSLTPPPPPMPTEQGRHLAATISAVFNGSNQTVRQELRDFARGRMDYDSALGEQRFLYDADAYMRFVCHAMVRRLMEVERERIAGR